MGVAAFVLWLGPLLLFSDNSKDTSTDFLLAYGPLLLAAFTIFSLLASSGENAIAFQPAEVDLLFPGPFTRRQLLAYKLLSGMIASLFGALIFSLVFKRHAGSWPVAFLGFILTLWFIQFLGTGLALIKQLVGEMAYTRARRFLVAAVLIAIAVAVSLGVQQQSFENLPELGRQINQSFAGRYLLAPFRVYSSLIACRTLEDAAKWAGIAVAINAALAVLVLRLDADYIEASIRASERYAERIRRARSGNMFAPAATGGKNIRSRRVSRMSWLGGAAPIVWRQSTTLARSGKKWAFQVLLILAFAGFMMGSFRRMNTGDAGMGIGVGVLAYITVALASMLRFDFRADLDHIETLKSLPLDPRAIALGELLLPCALLAAIQAMLIAAAAWVFNWPLIAIVSAGAAIPVVNVLLLGVENLLFLMFPARLNNRGVADFSLIGRQMLLFMGKALLFAVIAAIAVGAAYVVHLFTDLVPAAIATAWIVLAIAATGAVLGVARAFRAFDVSSDMPA